MKEETKGKDSSLPETSDSGTIEIPVGKWFGKMRTNPWMPTAIVLAVILIVVLFMHSGITGNAVSEQTVSDNILKFAKAQGVNASVSSVVLSGSLYQVSLNVNGQQVPVYVTLDGKQLIQQPIPLDGSVATGAQTTAPAASKKISDLNLSQFPSVGNVNAKVTVVEFSDFSCPYCEAASGDNVQMMNLMKQEDPSWQPIVTNLMKDYVATGKVRFVYIYSEGHTGGHSASLVGWCLNDQSSNLYWKYYPLVFASVSADTEDLAKMTALAKSVGADMTKLQACLDSKKYDSRFALEQSVADSVGAQGTPAFFVNDVYAAHGAESYVQFKQTVDAALAQ